MKILDLNGLAYFLEKIKTIFATKEQGALADTAIQSVKIGTTEYKSGTTVTLPSYATGAEVNQNAFSNVVVGGVTIAADSKTDTLTIVAGDNVTITPDATNDKITIATSGNATAATTANKLADRGTHAETASGTTGNAATTGMLETSGMYMTQTYNDAATPVNYGNIINLAGSGTGQLLCEWSGTDSQTGHLYYRSHRDTSTGGWGPWQKLMFETDISAFTRMVCQTSEPATKTNGLVWLAE